MIPIVYISLLFLSIVYILVNGIAIKIIYQHINKSPEHLKYKKYLLIYLFIVICLSCGFMLYRTFIDNILYHPYFIYIIYLSASLVIASSLFSIYVIIHHIIQNRISSKLSHFDISRRKMFTRMTMVSVFLGFLGSYMSFNEIHDFEVKEVSVPIKGLPDSFHNYRIIQLSDIHTSFFIRANYLERVVKKVQSLKGDLVVLTGDYLTHKEDQRFFHELTSVLGRLRDKYPIYAVLGNHDYWSGQEFVESELLKINIPVLNNISREIHKNSEKLIIVGIEDYTMGNPDIRKAIQGLSNDSIKILLSHNPDMIYEASKHSIHLMLSGHTHGGQIQIPFYGPILVPSRFGKRYAEGLHNLNDTFLYVTRGIGVISPPIRFSCRPEISVITLIKGV